MGGVEESGRAAHDAHLSDDEAVAKMGHPDVAAVTLIVSKSRQYPVKQILFCISPAYMGAPWIAQS